MQLPTPPEDGTVADWEDLTARFDRAGVQALALMGSYARGDPHPFSDVDLVRFTVTAVPGLPGSGSHVLAGRLVTVTDVAPDEVETYFVQPELAVNRIPGLRQGRALRDRDGFFAALQERARVFVWDAAMQERANAYANREMVGWIEEVHKGLAGLRSGDVGRLLDAEFGLSWGLNRLVEVQRGIPLACGEERDTDWFRRTERAVGPDSEWVRLHRQVFGIGDGERAPTLRQRVIAGLRLYVATSELLADVWTAKTGPLIDATVALVHEALRHQTVIEVVEAEEAVAVVDARLTSIGGTRQVELADQAAVVAGIG